MNVHWPEFKGRTLAVREWPGEGTPVLAWHAPGQAASGAFAGITHGAEGVGIA